MAEILREELAGRQRLDLLASVLPEIFEHERFSTTVANAVLVAARRRLRQAARRARSRSAATRATCCSCTPAAA